MKKIVQDEDGKSVAPMRIVVDGSGAFEEYAGRRIVQASIIGITGLPGGMKSGRTSAALFLELPDKTVVFGETSMRSLITALAAFQGVYGDEE